MNNEIITASKDAIELVESGLADADHVLQAIEFVKALGKLHRDLDARLKAASIEWIKKNGRIVSGTRTVYVAPDKTVKCVNVKATVEAVLTKCGGDMDSFVECLSANAFKPSATRKLLGDDGKDLFKEEITSKVKIEGEEVVVEKLQDFDSKVLENRR
jgi:hypothetical protein